MLAPAMETADNLLHAVVVWLVILTVLIFLVVLAVLVFLAWRFKKVLEAILSGKTEALSRKYAALRARHPEEEESRTLRRIIRAEARVAGVIGFLTGFAGLITLPIALPVDIVAVLRIQFRLASFLGRFRVAPSSGPAGQRGAQERGAQDQGVGGRGVKLLLLAAGAHQARAMGGKIAVRVLTQFAPKIFLEAVPLLGGLIGFAIDFASTRAVGEIALRKLLTPPPEETFSPPGEGGNEESA